MSIISLELNGRACRTYLVYDELSHEAILIDPVIDLTKSYLKMIDQKELALIHVIDTHTHADHLSGGAVIKEQADCDYVMHHTSKVSQVNWWLYEGICCYLGNEAVRVMHTPGHTKDSVSIIVADWIFAGDCLFLNEGGAGRLDLPGGDTGEHWDSLQRILTLPDHFILHPAHDYRGRAPSSIAEQKNRNPYLVPRTRQAYIAFAKGLRYGPAEWMKDVLRLNEECVEASMRAYVLPHAGNVCENVCEASPAPRGEISIPHITPEAFNRELKSVDSPVLLDVREAEELIGDLPSIAGIIHIPMGSIEERCHELDPYKEESIVVICRSGKRALRAALVLQENGFERVSVLEGGMLAWEGK